MNAQDKLNVLLIEDDEDDYFITKKYLKDIPDKEITLDWISSFEEAKQALSTSQHDICLVDYRLGENTGLELLRYAEEIKYRTPTIILTGQADHKTDIEATEAGASDFLVKAELNSRQLERTFRYTIKMQQTMERLRQARDSLKAEIEVRKQTEASLVKAMKAAETANHAKAEFLSNMSHEMRTPMHAILGYAELGEADIHNTPREKLEQYFSHISSSGKRLLVLITTLLNLTELDAGHAEFDMQEADLVEIVEAATADQTNQLQDKSLSLTVNTEEACYTAQCDITQILQVINHMLHNAIRYTPQGRSLTLSLSPATLTNSQHTVPAITFSVSDQGVGIPEGELESIFDAFVQSTKTKTGAGGTGLGLNVCKKIIEGHHGKIWAENNALEGATFSFTIPVTQNGH